jgi:protein-disulfide isomerase
LRPTIFTRTLIVLGALTFAGSVWAAGQNSASGSFTSNQVRDIEQIVRDYILNHPEIIGDAIQKLQEKQRAEENARLSEAAKGVKPVSAEDHVQGNPNAPVKVVEFSDFECPFCKSFHPTMKRIMDEYGKDGKVAWIYRHFPLDEIHSKARKEAQAAECANELGGNTAFWAFANRLFEIAPSNNRLDLKLLPQIAQEIGLDRTKFESCLAGDARGGKYAAHIEANAQDAVASGATGTPYSLVIDAKGHFLPINGAQPYDAVKAIIDAGLNN